MSSSDNVNDFPSDSHVNPPGSSQFLLRQKQAILSWRNRRNERQTAPDDALEPTIPNHSRSRSNCLFRHSRADVVVENHEKTRCIDSTILKEIWRRFRRNGPPPDGKSARPFRLSSFFTQLQDRSDAAINAFVDQCRANMIPIRPISIIDNCLQCQGYELSDAHCDALRQAIRSVPTVDGVDIEKNSVGPEGAAILVTSARQLHYLNMAYNNVGLQGAHIWGQFIGQTECHLVHIDLSGNGIGPYGANLICQGLIHNQTVQFINLAGNDIGNEGAKPVSNILIVTKTLRILNLKQNKLTHEGSAYISAAMEKNRSLSGIILSWNSFFGSSGVLLAKALQSHPSVVHVDISCCEIGVEAGIVLAHAIRMNSRLEQIHLSRNPLGSSARVIIWAMTTSPHLEKRRVSMAGCDFEHAANANNTFDPRFPNGQRILDMQSEYHRALASEILALSTLPGASKLSNVLVGQQQFNGIDLRVPNPWRSLPEKGVLQFEFYWYPRPAQSDDALDEHAFQAIYALLKDPEHGTDESRADLFLATCSSLNFAKEQIIPILQLFSKGSSELILVASVLSIRMVDGPLCHENLVASQFMSNSSDTCFCSTDHLIIDAAVHGFTRSNPTGHYNLRLSSPIDRTIAMTLMQISGWYSLFHLDAGDCDWSQAGNRHLWRNSSLDGNNFIFDSTFQLPGEGVLKTDFSFRVGPNISSTLPMPAQDFVTLLDNINEQFLKARSIGTSSSESLPAVKWVNFLPNVVPTQSPGNVALKRLKGVCATEFFIAEQAKVILSCFPERDLFRMNAFICMYNRIIGDNEVRSLFRSMFSKENQNLIMIRLGYLALWNPFYPSTWYRIDLQHRDGRHLSGLIMRMTLIEHNSMIFDVVLDGKHIDLPAIWIAKMPEHGVLEFQFRETPLPHLPLRERLAVHSLGWTPSVIWAASAEFKSLRVAFSTANTHVRKQTSVRPLAPVR